jgi:S-formylglutathione hydrolase FrmB
MVLEDFLPRLAAQGFQADRPAFLGWSMGGLGALYLAARRSAPAGTNGPVLAVSPALWPDYDQTAPGAFDDAADFDEVMALVRGDAAGPTRVDCGTGDHTRGYWTRVLPDQLAWLGGQLTGTAH